MGLVLRGSFRFRVCDCNFDPRDTLRGLNLQESHRIYAVYKVCKKVCVDPLALFYLPFLARFFAEKPSRKKQKESGSIPLSFWGLWVWRQNTIIVRFASLFGESPCTRRYLRFDTRKYRRIYK